MNRLFAGALGLGVILVFLFGALIMSDARRYWIKEFAGETRVYQRGEEWLAATDIRTVGWEGRLREELGAHLAGFLGRGFLLPQWNNWEVLIWAAGPGRDLFEDRRPGGFAFLHPVDDSLLWRDPSTYWTGPFSGELVRWNGDGFQPLRDDEIRVVASKYEYIRQAEETSEWKYTDIAPQYPGVVEHDLGDFTLEVERWPRHLHVEVRLSLRGQVARSLPRGDWKRVTRDVYEARKASGWNPSAEPAPQRDEP